MSVTTIYETVGDAWKTNIGPSINSIPSDAFVAFQDQAGNLDVINQASKEMAGGLVSDNVPVPAGAKYFGFDVVLDITAEDLPHLARCENDMKITFVGGAQANGSCQWNADKKIWQLGANDGSGWVDTGYTNPLVVGRNKLQLRLAFDGKVWSFTGIRGYVWLFRFGHSLFHLGTAYYAHPSLWKYFKAGPRDDRRQHREGE
jgi:hypothetical protein